VLCPPFGYEYTHAHRSLLHLADDLAAAGFLTARLDYVGTGDSEGDASTPDLLERWVESVTEVARVVTTIAGGPPSLVGLRFGALIAGLAATRMDVQNLVAWCPVTSGRRYIREHEALQSVGAQTPTQTDGTIEAGGFVLSAETAEAVRRVDLSDASLRVRGSALVLDRDDLKPDTRLAERLEALGVTTEVAAGSGYLGMMAEPQYTVVPQATIDTLVGWLSAHDAAGPTPLDAAALSAATATPRARWTERDRGIAEEWVAIPRGDRRALVGVLTVPDAGTPATETVLLANSGSVHHVGPNRLYVELARALANAGVACLRLDLRNLGDSRVGECPDENHPYPETAVEDVGLAVAWLRARGTSSCIVAGLCSGAHTAFHAGLDLQLPVRGVVCMNPLTFQWKAGMSLDTPDSHRTTRDAQYYRGAVRNWAKWKRLLTGKANVRYIATFAAKRVRDVVRKGAENVAERVGMRPMGLLGQRLEAYRSNGRPLRFVFSTRDPGHAILVSEAGPVLQRLTRGGAISIAFIQEADHTFSRALWRRQAGEALLAAMRGMSASPR
jgi:alpha-beta hydrolase superfamily lysophospholipase